MVAGTPEASVLICLRDWLSVLEKEQQHGMKGRRRNKTQMGVERWNGNLEHAGLGRENLDKTVTRGEMRRNTGSPGALGLRHAAVWGGALLATSHSHHLCLSLEYLTVTQTSSCDSTVVYTQGKQQRCCKTRPEN